jgi:mannitol-specific phosphotransferase system IIBC component
MDYWGVMALPIKTFWMLSQNVERILAQRDMRALTVAVSGQGGEAARDHRQALIKEVGTIAKLVVNPILDAERDEAGFAMLREMARVSR